MRKQMFTLWDLGLGTVAYEGAVSCLADLEGTDFRGSNLEGAHFYLATHRAPERAIASRYPRTRTIRI